MPIHFLSPEDAQKVAAGEVVERPANVIKELIENSIDAQASSIELFVKQGGKEQIKITDNGCGMSQEDAILCFERHATSKLFCFDDLPMVSTFGFRGEALASVCGVAKVSITTKQKDHIEAVQLSIQEGKVVAQQAVSGPVGTTIVVDDLFYNIPVRKKFLKTTITEWNQIVSLFKSFCLTYPHIHFTLFHDDARVYNCPPVTTVLDRVAQLFDPIVFSNVAELCIQEERGITVTGVITNPHYSRYDRNGLYFFVNNRLVKNYQLARAVLKGYCNVLPHNKYPFAVIHLTIDPLMVDVNIHPKKEEVLFLHPHLVEQAITKAVTATLEKHTVETQKGSPYAFPGTVTQTFRETDVFPIHSFAQQNPAPLFSDAVPRVPQDSNAAAEYPAVTHVFPKETQETVPVFKSEPQYRIVGQFHKTYILLDTEQGLVMVDQHAAHERILYEQFGKNFGKTETIELLFPVLVTVSTVECAALIPYLSLLEQQGIVCESFGEQQLRITAVPVYAKNISLSELIHELIGWIEECTAQPETDLFKKITEKIRAQLACKAAVKAGDILTMQAMEQLLLDLNKTEKRFSCPHGRPTQWLINIPEIEKRFKRITS